MTVRIPKWLVWSLSAVIVLGALTAAFLLGRSSDGEGEGDSTVTVSTPAEERVAEEATAAVCSKPMAERATLRSGFADSIRSAGIAAAELAGEAPGEGPRFFTDNPVDLQVRLLRCADLTGDGVDEMVVGIGGGAAARIYQWAIFTSDGDGGWRTAFEQVGNRVSSIDTGGGSVSIRTPIYASTDPLCCPSGYRSTRVAYRGGEFRVVSPAPSARDREVVVAADGSVTRLGRLRPQRDSPVQAAADFGTPTGIEDDGDVCRLSWGDLGLSITFANFGGREACGSAGHVATFDLTGTPAAQAGWRTAEGARVGIGVGALLDLYPGAERGDGELILIEKSSPIGEDGTIAVMTGYPVDGRALAFRFYVGAAGE